MRHFPIFRDLKGRRVVVCGAGETAVAKLRLLLRTEARIAVYGADPLPEVEAWAREGRLALTRRAVEAGDATCAALLYAAHDDAAEDARAARIGREAGALVNVVDDLEASDFITPALVDRDPVTVAIGTEGAAPVLARRIKAQTEERLHQGLGALAVAGRAFRGRAEAIPQGRARRAFWSRWYDEEGPRALAEARDLHAALDGLLREALADRDEGTGSVALIGAGPGDPELLTLKARRLLHEADVVIHDRLVPPAILELARREARIVEVGKVPYGPAWSQDEINALTVRHAAQGARVARLKSGDPGVFGRLDEEVEALEAAALPYEVVPGVTAASAAAADARVSLTRRGRNKALTLITGHDAEGFAEQDWRALAAPGAAAAVYMGVRAARFVQGRLLMHGADRATPVTVVENASRPGRRVVASTVDALPDDLRAAGIDGPAILLLGIAAREAASVAPAREARA